MSLGFAPHRCINIIGFNSTEWFIANVGAIAAGGIAAGIYTSNLPEVCVKGLQKCFWRVFVCVFIRLHVSAHSGIYPIFVEIQ